MQSRVARTIKHARALGLFSYKGGAFRIMNPMDTTTTYTRESEKISNDKWDATYGFVADLQRPGFRKNKKVDIEEEPETEGEELSQ